MMFVLLFLFFLVAVANSSIVYDKSTCRTTSLANSTWPSDHGDSSRTKYTIGAGLPANFNPADLKVLKQTDVHSGQWIYTAGENSSVVYTMGNVYGTYKVNRLDSVSLELLQAAEIKSSPYLGGMLMHANGHVYAVQGNVVYVFWNGDLNNKTEKVIPTSLNGDAVQTNGVVVTSDGLLVIRQWSLVLEDLLIYTYAFPSLKRIFLGILVVAASIPFIVSKKQKGILHTLISSAFAVLFTLFLILVLIIGMVRKKSNMASYNIPQFILGNLLLPNDGGELKLIDPITLEVVSGLKLPERCSFGRTALHYLEDEDEDAIIVLGDESVHQVRWNLSNQKLSLVEDWSEKYRSRWEGSFPGTGPAIHNGVVYFTDNTFPVTLSNQTYSLFRKSLRLEDKDTMKSPEMIKRSLVLDPSVGAGYMYWSTVISPLTNSVIVWDSAGHNVQARDINDLSLLWNITAHQFDCISVAADKGHLYVSDYSSGPAPAWDNVAPAMGPFSEFKHVDKFLLVIDVSNGNILANVTVAQSAGMSVSMIVPGANDDVFVGYRDGLVRVHI